MTPGASSASSVPSSSRPTRPSSSPAPCRPLAHPSRPAAYAAAHASEPPARLRDLTETPAPLDPMTGQPFAYRVESNQVTIEAPVVELAAPRPPACACVDHPEVKLFPLRKCS